VLSAELNDTRVWTVEVVAGDKVYSFPFSLTFGPFYQKDLVLELVNRMARDVGCRERFFCFSEQGVLFAEVSVARELALALFLSHEDKEIQAVQEDYFQRLIDNTLNGLPPPVA